MFGLSLQKNSLVVLSACETGRVEATHSNEVLGMVRSLLYAGAGRLVRAAWEVNAGSTRRGWRPFIKQGQSSQPAEAARLGPGCGEVASGVQSSLLLGPVSHDRKIKWLSLWSDFTEKLGSLAGKWTAYAAFGSFLLYLLGYLTLRFQLSTYGVATDLDLVRRKVSFRRMPLSGEPGFGGAQRPHFSSLCWQPSDICRTS